MARAASGQNVEEQTRERAVLWARVSGATDDAAHETWNHALALHDERAEGLRALEPVRQQAEAQIVATIEAFRAVQAALVALSLAPAGRDYIVAPELTGVTETVQRLNAQARAAEDAAREVAALRVGR